jgi:hypothetical protein
MEADNYGMILSSLGSSAWVFVLVNLADKNNIIDIISISHRCWTESENTSYR